MTIYVIFQFIMMVLAVVFIGYPFTLGILALLPKNDKAVQNARNHSFLIVVHAHNQEQEVSKTLYSLVGLVYPWNLYDLLVIADNCTDNTATASKKLGAKVIECNSPDWNGPANILLQTLEQEVEHLYEKYDALVFVKPNDLISGNFLEIMDRYLEEGSAIIQSAKLRISELITWKIKYRRVIWLLRTYIEAVGRKKMGFGTILLGSGMCFKTDFLEKNPIKLSHTQGDFDYSILLQENDLRVNFASEAVIWTLLDDSSAEDELDQTYWAIRKFRVIMKHLKYSIIHFSDGKLLQRFELLIWMIKPPLILVLAVAMGSWIINLVLWRLGSVSAWFWVIWAILSSMDIIFLSIGIVADRGSSSFK